MLSDIEERVVVKHIEDIDQRGFLKHVDHVREMALEVLQEQEGTPTLGKHWIPRFLNRHPHLASKFSSQVKKQQIVNSKPKALKHSFDTLGPLIKKYNIQPYNIYNMDEKAIQMGKST